MIDRQTVERIKETANIVDVVSEFVTLKRSGANYKGLCPFHNEKTPSFYVSPARGTCHCFGCGKGGNAVSFIMEHEQMTYPEALRWLANKYHIEIHERELSSKEKEEQSQRESMFIVNEWAAKYFEDLLHNHADGVAIGMQYFRSRGFRDDIIRKFHLGFDVSDRHALARTALQKGYKEEFLLKTGICYRTDRGELINAEALGCTTIRDPYFFVISTAYYLCYTTNDGTYIQRLNLSRARGASLNGQPTKIADASFSDVCVFRKSASEFYLLANVKDGAGSTIRYARAEAVTGPYLDKSGASLADGSKGELLIDSGTELLNPENPMRVFLNSEQTHAYVAYNATEAGKTQMTSGFARRPMILTPIALTDDGWFATGTTARKGWTAPRFE